MDSESEGLAILSLLGLHGVGPARVGKVIAWARERERPLGALLERPDRADLPLTSDQIQGLRASAERAALWGDKLHEVGATLIPITDARYPSTLRRHLGAIAPPVLTAIGNPSVLGAGGVGFCGSRAASEKGLQVATDCTSQLARAHINVVSGYAAGVDMAAHEAALRAGGKTVFVLAEGILHFKIKRAIEGAWDPERVVVVSEFLPDSVWSVHNAMRRNRTICGLSQAVVLIEARPDGGSIAAGKASLHLGIPLFAAVFEGSPASAAGNRELLKGGARQLLRNKSTGRANILPILDVLKASASTTGPEAAPLLASR